MIRIKVFPLRKIINKIQVIFLLTIFLITILILISLIYKQKDEKAKEIISMALIKTEANVYKSKFINNILKNKVRVLYNIDYDDYAEEKEQENEIKNLSDNINSENRNTIVENNINIEIIENKKWDKPNSYITKLYENGKIGVGNIVISNYSKLSLDLNKLQKPSDIKITNDTSFLLFHTHTSETYTIKEEEYSDYYRTQNENYNMIAVGNALNNALNVKGYKCLHEKTVHDYPSYNGAYKASLKTVENCLKEKNYDFIIDIHRDAISSNENYRPTVEINGNSAAKLMFVVGTNAAGLSHDKWMENLKLAIMIQNRAEEMYPRII